MKTGRAASIALMSGVLIAGILAPARATDELSQNIGTGGGAVNVEVGIDDSGLATAVYPVGSAADAFIATRKPSGRFGPGVSLGTGLVYNDLLFDQSDNGNALVVYENGNQIAGLVRTGAANGFGRVEQISQTTVGYPRSPDGVISNSGRAAVAWFESSSPTNLLASIYENGQWSAPQVVASGDQLDWANLGADASGNLLLVWAQEGGNAPAINAATSAPGAPFSAPKLIENLDQGGGNEPVLDVNEAGDAVLNYEDAVEASVCGTNCSFFWNETRYGDVSGTFGPAQTTATNGESGWAPSDAHVSIDDTGEAVVVMNMSTPNDTTTDLLARTSDATGTFGAVQTLDEDFSAINERSFAVDAGGGEFSVVWVDAEAAVYRSHSVAGTFEPAHTLASGLEGADDAAVGRNDSGQYVAGWTAGFPGQPFAVPVTSGPTFIQGTETADVITGTAGADVAVLEAGDDTFRGAGGADNAKGEEGADKLFGDAGNDTLGGGGGNDRVIGGGGNDVLTGEGGADYLDGGAGTRNRLNGGPGRDTCVKRSRSQRLRSCEVVLKRFR